MSYFRSHIAVTATPELERVPSLISASPIYERIEVRLLRPWALIFSQIEAQQETANDTSNHEEVSDICIVQRCSKLYVGIRGILYRCLILSTGNTK
jgi:hypothetical protein